MEKLWWAEHKMLQTVGVFRRLLAGYGPNIPKGSNPGENRQPQRLFERKLPMGHTLGAEQQSQIERLHKNTKRKYDNGRSIKGVWFEENNPSLSSEERVAFRKTLYSSKCHKPSKYRVYDILNCGPRNRFVVKGENGPIIVHNCVQAAARDILAEWMHRIDQRGLKIIGHVHDEVVVEDENDVVEEMNDCIRSGVEWAPGLLLDAAGFTTRRYYKD
jgi:DNA polymerase